MLEAFTFLCFGPMPMLSPLISMYFITPYKKHVMSLLGVALKKTLPTTMDSVAREPSTASTSVTYC